MSNITIESRNIEAGVVQYVLKAQLLQGGIQGPPGPPGPSGAGLLYHQEALSDTWLIQHNLGTRPSATISLDNGELIASQVVYIDNNNLAISLNAPATGYVRLA